MRKVRAPLAASSRRPVLALARPSKGGVAPLAILPLLVACVSLPVVPAAPRGYAERERAAIRLDVACESTGGHTGSGVVTDERHALTAAHVVACPEMPLVIATTADGRRLFVVVTKEDHARDFAVLELESGDRFHLDVAPPLRAPAVVGSHVCSETAIPVRGSNCGPVIAAYPDFAHVAAVVMKGNSGSGVYDMAGRLVGIVVNMTADWMGVSVVP